MSDWITGKELKAHHELRDFELFKYVKKGLQPYDAFERPVTPSDLLDSGGFLESQIKGLKSKIEDKRREIDPSNKKWSPLFSGHRQLSPREISIIEKEIEQGKERIRHWEEKLASLKGITWIDTSFPESKIAAEEIFRALDNALYKKENAEKLELVTEEVTRSRTKKGEKDSKESTDLAEKEDEHLNDLELIELITKVKPEIELIYNAMKKKVGFSAYTPDIETELQKQAISTFTSRKNKFAFIKIEHLKDSKIYELNPGQSKRDFVGRLLGKFVEEHTDKIIGSQKLYEVYKEIEKFSTNTI